MHNKSELESMSIEEVKDIAKELGIPTHASDEQIDLIYRILDEESIRSAQKASETKTPRKRTRISKKETDKVYSASQLGEGENFDLKKKKANAELAQSETSISKIEDTAVIEVRGHTLAYVSRGGLKLEKAMETFSGLALDGAVCADIGASTGGFTDCMLQNGAVKVYAVDVGYGQLAWSLRSDERVVCLERTNARYLTHEQIPDELDFASVDVSFISLKLILPALRGLLKENGQVVCLVKPQFEAGREKVGKKGVVRDPAVHLEVIQNFLGHAAEADFTVKDMTFSPIRGPEGNIEYLGHLLAGGGGDAWTGDPAALVEASHAALEGAGQ